MSIHLASLVWKTELGGPAVKAVAMKLADCAHDDGTHIWPSVKTIARETEVSERTVRTCLKKLVERGLIFVHKKGGSGAGDTTVYNINIPWLIEQRAETQKRWDAEASTDKDANSACFKDKAANQPDKPATVVNKGATVAAEPSGTINRTLRAQAREKNSHIENKRVPFVAIDLTPSDCSWRSWIEHLRAIDRNDLADAAEASERMTVGQRWPDKNSPLPKIDRRATAKPALERMTGDAA